MSGLAARRSVRPVLLGAIALIAVVGLFFLPAWALPERALMVVVGATVVAGLATAAVLRPTWVVLLLTFTLPLAPEFQFGELSTRLSMDRTKVVNVTASPAELVVAVLALGLLVIVLRNLDKRLHWHRFLTFALLFVVAAGVSIALAAGPLGGNVRVCVLYLGRVAEVMAMFAFGYYLGGAGPDIRRILRAATVAGLLLMVQAIASWLAGEVEYISAMGNRMALGGQVTPFACFLALTAASRRGSARIILFALALVLCGLLLVTEKRAVLVGLAAAVVAVLLMTGLRRAGVAALVGAAIVLSLTWASIEAQAERSFSGTAGRYRVSSGLSVIDESQLDVSIVGRFIAWEDTWDSFVEAPIIGIGFWGSVYRDRHLPHNQYLQMLGETGLIGAILFFGALWQLFRIGWRSRWIRDPEVRRFGIAYLAGLVGLAAQAFFEQIFLMSQMMGTFYLLGGLLARWIDVEESPPPAGAPEA